MSPFPQENRVVLTLQLFDRILIMQKVLQQRSAHVISFFNLVYFYSRDFVDVGHSWCLREYAYCGLRKLTINCRWGMKRMWRRLVCRAHYVKLTKSHGTS